MKIAVIEKYSSDSKCHRQNRNSDWEWDITHRYEYGFYSDSESLTKRELQIVYNFINRCNSVTKETVEENYPTTPPERISYDLYKSRQLANLMNCEIFEPYEYVGRAHAHKVYMNEFHDFEFGWGQELVDDISVVSLPVIKYLHLTKESNLYVGIWNGRRIEINNENKLYSPLMSISAEFADCICSCHNEKYAVVLKDGKYGVIDKEGSFAVNFQNEKIVDVYESFCIIERECFIDECECDDIKSCMNLNGEILMPFTNLQLKVHEKRYVEISNGNVRQIYDPQTHAFIFLGEYQEIIKISEYYIVTKSLDGDIVVYDHQSHNLTKERLIEVEIVGEYFLKARDANNRKRIMLFNAFGNILFDDESYSDISVEYNHIRLLSKSQSRMVLHGLAKFGGEIIFPCRYTKPIRIMHVFESGENSYGEWVEWETDYYIVYENNKMFIVDSQGYTVSDLYSYIYNMSDGVCIAIKGAYEKINNRISLVSGRYHILRPSGEELFNIDCQQLFMYKYGKALFKKDNKYGMLDLKGNCIISPQYDALRAFHKGYAAAYVNNKWGFIDENGNIVIDFIYDYITNFDDFGNAYVELDGRYNYINVKGEYNGEWREKEHQSTFVTSDYSDNIIDDDYIQDGLKEAFGGDAYARWNID